MLCPSDLFFHSGRSFTKFVEPSLSRLSQKGPILWAMVRVLSREPCIQICILEIISELHGGDKAEDLVVGVLEDSGKS